MSWLLVVQVWLFVCFVAFALDRTVQAIAKKLFPTSWGRGLCTFVIGVLVAGVLFSTVPGRARHLDFIKQTLLDEIAGEDFNGGDSGLVNWLGAKVVGFAADIAVQKIRVENSFFISIGLAETEWGWSPVTIGFAGIVFRSFFIDIPTYETPDVVVALSKDSEDNWQVELCNTGDAEYACAVSSWLNPDRLPLCEFDLNGKAEIRIRQQKKGFVNKVKSLLDKDKTVVTIPEPIAQGLRITFKSGQRVLKSARLTLLNDALHVDWHDPK